MELNWSVFLHRQRSIVGIKMSVKLLINIRAPDRRELCPTTSHTFMRNTLRPDLTALSSKVNSFSRMIARLSLSPVYVTT